MFVEIVGCGRGSGLQCDMTAAVKTNSIDWGPGTGSVC